MSYIIIELLSIKVRRFIEKMTGNKDANIAWANKVIARIKELSKNK